MGPEQNKRSRVQHIISQGYHICSFPWDFEKADKYYILYRRP